jgi:hypothetical protein
LQGASAQAFSEGKANATYQEVGHFPQRGPEKNNECVVADNDVTSERKTRWRNQRQRAFRNKYLQRSGTFGRSDTESSEDEIDRIWMAKMVPAKTVFLPKKKPRVLVLVDKEVVDETSIMFPVSKGPFRVQKKVVVEQMKIVHEQVQENVAVPQVVVQHALQAEVAPEVELEYVPDSEEETMSQLLEHAL